MWIPYWIRGGGRLTPGVRLCVMPYTTLLIIKVIQASDVPIVEWQCHCLLLQSFILYSGCVGISLWCCCCLPTPMTLASGGSPMFPLVVHQPASPSIWPAVQSLRRGLSTNPGVTMWCVCGCSWRDDVCRVCGCYRGGIVVMDVFWRRLCVSMIWGREICLFWAGQGCDEWGGEVSLQSC